MLQLEKAQKVGELRPSQLVFTFGVGSLLNLPNISALVMGLDDWVPDPKYEISEDRLIAAIKRQLGNQVSKLYIPPVTQSEVGEGPIDETPTGVPVVPFPRWGKCSRCHLLAPIDSSGIFELATNRYYPDQARFVHVNCTKANKPPVLPVRFLMACRNGHLDDFPWLEYVHRGSCDHRSAILRLTETGPSGEAADIWVSCETCDVKPRSMAEAFNKDTMNQLISCSGNHPHLRTTGESCEEEIKTVLLSASNAWFPLMLSALAIPRSYDKLAQMVDEYWSTLDKATSIDVLKGFRAIGQLSAFSGYTDEDVWNAVQDKQKAMSDGSEDETEELKLPEWEAFSTADHNLNSDDFKLKVQKSPTGYEHLFEKTVLAERLRQVCALIGFTRVESPGDFMELGEIDDQRRAPLSRKSPNWVPATEVRGEGLFLQFNENKVQEWCRLADVQNRAGQLFQAHRNWRTRRNLKPPEANFLGIRFALLHSFAHALMRQLAMECGYTPASIRERIYSKNPDEEGGPMAGVLIYTGAPDSEGTLGGLVRLGDPDTLGRHIDQALEEMRLCTSDPYCAECQGGSDGVSLHMAACHACLFAPETSCERGNKYLDRACLVTTFGSDMPAYFEQE